MDWLPLLNLACVGLLCAAALSWGAAPERMCATAFFAMTCGDPIYHFLAGRGPIYGSIDVGHLIMDAGVAAVFVGVALCANRVYPLWLSAFQLKSVLSHFARGVTEGLPHLAYGIMSHGPYYLILMIMAGGLWCHVAREREYGMYRPWRVS